MADVTISALGALTPIVDSIVLPASTSNGSSTGKVTISNINSLAPVQSVASRTGAIVLTKTDVGLSLVENKSSATIRGEITSGNVTTALGFTPYNNTNPSGYITASSLPASQQLVRAWINFDGTRNANNTGASQDGANVYIRSSYNISSVYKNGVGDFTINITPGVFNDGNYCAIITVNATGLENIYSGCIKNLDTPTSTTIRIRTGLIGTAFADCQIINLSFFR